MDISGFGIKVNLTASITFPNGIEITQFADDADPIDQASLQLRDKAMGVNGNLIVWSKANPILATLNVIPNGQDDKNLQVLAVANRVGKGKKAVQDEITMVITYPDESVQRLIVGSITDSIIGKPVQSSGRQKTKPYAFAFENFGQ